MYYRRIICDIDDTISITKNRDWINAEPVQQVIDKLNFLYELGWEIWLVTARGQLSCNGKSEEADKKYRVQIESWLKEHGVKYHLLSFNKYLATYYIDDKNLTPEKFISLDIKPLKKGWSGAIVELHNGRVYKTHKNSIDASEWYKIAENFFYVPKIYSLIGETLCMEYIEINTPLKLQGVIEVIEKCRSIRHEYADFSIYIERINTHCKHSNKFYQILPHLESIEKFCNDNKTFCHGDLTLENILPKNGNLYLIDPIFSKNDYLSYLLDITKFILSLRKNQMFIELEYIQKYFSYLPSNVILILEITQWIRIYKYAPNEEKIKIDNIINELCLKL